MLMNHYRRLSLVLPGLAVLWQFLVGNWLNSPRCVVDAWRMAHGSALAFAGTPYWAKFSLCVDPYWVNQWLKNYGAGFVKRGLIGSVLGFFGDSVDLLLLNLASLVIQALIIYLLLFLVCRLFQPSILPLASIWIACFWLTPFGKVMAETAGDPLQLILLMWLSLGAWLARVHQWCAANRVAADLVVGFVFCVSVLVYEGSFLLFFAPFLLLGRRTTAWWLSGAVAVALTVAMSGSEPLEMEPHISRALVGVNPLNGLEMAYRAGGGIASQVSFMDNFWMELERYAQSPWTVLSELRGALAVFGVWFVAFASLVLSGLSVADFGGSGRVWIFIRRLVAWLVIALIMALPFLFVTHDWVRYLAILLGELMMLCSVEGSRLGLSIHSLNASKGVPSTWFGLLSFALLSASITVGPASIDVRTSLPPEARMPYTILFVAGSVLVFMLSVISRRQAIHCDHSS